jgi:CHAT domain-containing protein
MRVLEAESAVRLAAEGEILYQADPVKRTGFEYCSLALGYAEKGDLRLAIREASKALFLGQRTADQYLLALAKRDLAYAYSLAGYLERAAQFADESIEHFQWSRNRDASAIGPAYKTKGDVRLRQGRIDEALADFQQALMASSMSFRPFVQVSLANAYLARGNSVKARELFLEAQRGASGALQPLIRRGLGQLALAEGQIQEAIRLFREAADKAAGADQAYHRLWALDGLARAQKAAGELTLAIATYQKAIGVSEQVRARFRSEEFKTGFFGDVQQIFDEAVALLMEEGQVEVALEASERSRARALLDLLRGRVQVSAGSQAFVDPLGQVISVSQLQNALPEGVTLIQYHVLPRLTYAWIIRRSSISSARIDADRENLRKDVRQFRESIRERAPHVTELASKLYGRILRPLALKGSESVVIVPHDVLHYLPFQVLRSPEGYVIEERGISYAPSASAFVTLLNRQKRQSNRVLALGNPDLGAPQLNLPGAQREVEQIQLQFPEAEVYVRKQATKERLLARAVHSEIVHLATHAEVDEIDPLFSVIRLAGTETQHGNLEAHEVYRLDLSGNTLTLLSACETGLGRVSRGDELWGFTRAFLSAGVSSLLVSFWPVEDESTAQLMASFYKNLKTMTRVEALRQAQLNLIRGNLNSDLLARRGIGGVGKLGEVSEGRSRSQDSVAISTSHPYFWAPFILVGEGK